MSEVAIIIPTDISQMVKEIEIAYSRYLNEFRIPDDHVILVNFSAGKDSTTTAMIAHHLFGDRVRSVMADTDNEHELTIQFAKDIHLQIGSNPVEVVNRPIEGEREMILDKLLMFSEAQAVTVSAASSDVIDLGPIDGTRRDIGVGTPLEFFVNVNTAATAADAATVNIQLQTSADNAAYGRIHNASYRAIAGLRGLFFGWWWRGGR
ncbi:hypothetical protein PEC302107_36070 [Pectobacterium araliae]|nr:hypothetical protein PEC302107_36070 [Pectobacterium carotovorum subsp. carotovorum]